MKSENVRDRRRAKGRDGEGQGQAMQGKKMGDDGKENKSWREFSKVCNGGR